MDQLTTLTAAVVLTSFTHAQQWEYIELIEIVDTTNIGISVYTVSYRITLPNGNTFSGQERRSTNGERIDNQTTIPAFLQSLNEDPSPSKPPTATDLLNLLGKQGWELVSVIPATNGGNIFIKSFYLKRKLQ